MGSIVERTFMMKDLLLDEHPAAIYSRADAERRF
jgi:hypothetical protein